MDAGLPKQERLHGKLAIGRLLAEGRYGYEGSLKYCWLAPNGEDVSRVMVSVSKRFFKRAVGRNLLKRRLREAYRTRKGLLPAGVDLLLVYNSKEVADSRAIGEWVEKALLAIAGRIVTPEAPAAPHE